MSDPFLQKDQPEGVPPLELTGERTLPDVPEENYWYRRHLVVYEWIARRVSGLDVADLACGEGYGSEVLGRTARSVIGVDANPEAYAHAAARYSTARISFRRDLVEAFEGPCDAIVFLQTIEHIEDPDRLLEGFARAAPTSFISTPNLLTLAPPGAEKSDNPWHIREYRADQFEALLSPHFTSVELFGVFHAGRLAWHDRALAVGWDRVHATFGLTRTFYDWFTPSIGSSDFRVRRGDLDRALDFVAICRA